MNSRFHSPLTLILTSTLAPEGANAAQLFKRREQYDAALRFWINYPDDRIKAIVYCDNSGADLEFAMRLANQTRSARDVEVLSCADNRIPLGMHYGYPELGMIDFTLRTSQLALRTNHFAKITGRLIFPQLSNLLNNLPVDFDACIDHRRAYRKERKSWSDLRARTQLMIFRRSFYHSHLLGKRSMMLANKISHIEEFIPNIINDIDDPSKKIIKRWPVECSPSGIGKNGDNFDSMTRRLKYLVSSCARKYAPNLWI